MASSRSLPDLSLAALEQEQENDLDALAAPPSPVGQDAPSLRALTPSRSPSPEQEMELELEQLRTPSGVHFFASNGSPRAVASPRFQDEDWADAREDDSEEEEEGGGEGGPGTFTLHHPTRARSDYSIHSAPELDTAHFERLEPESPTPSSPASPTARQHTPVYALHRLPYTLWDYLQEEVRSLASRALASPSLTLRTTGSSSRDGRRGRRQE